MVQPGFGVERLRRTWTDHLLSLRGGNVGKHRHAGAHQFETLLIRIEHDAHGQALSDLGEIAGRILWCAAAVGRAAGGANAINLALDTVAGERIDRDLDLLSGRKSFGSGKRWYV